MKRLYHGAAFYPELWDEGTIQQDIEMMKQTGINVVRIGEFAWSVLEPEEGRIDVSLFRRMIEQLYENGIETIMCTPTPTPPIWMSHGHPERMYVDANGTRMVHGSRQHVCTNHPYFRERARIITEHIAKELGRIPGLIGWQLDNEFKCHVAECMCETCRDLWHKWLEQTYKTIDRLNEAWGTHIWSQHYQTFQQVPQPGPAPFLHNSSLTTMYQLFSMEKIAEFAEEQAAVIREHSSAPITHNSSMTFHVDNERLFRDLDFASFDTYATQELAGSYLMNCDLWRNFKKNKSFWIMETSTSFSASLASYANPHPAGYVKAEAVAAYALGAEAFCYWLWRQQRTGCEQPHGSVLSAWGKPTVGYSSVLEVEEARKEIEAVIISSQPSQAEVAMTYSDRAKAFFKTEPHRDVHYKRLVTHFYEQIAATGIHRDVIPEGADLDGYKLLFTPFLPYIPPEYMEKAIAFVEDGGIWIAGPLTGGRTEQHTVHTNVALGDVELAAGANALFTFPMDDTGAVGHAFGKTAKLGMWSTVFEEGASTVGTIEGGLTPGRAFITEHPRGKGKIVLLGAMPMGEEGADLLQMLVRYYAQEADVTLRTDVTAGTIVAPRQWDGECIFVIINMDGKGGTVTIPCEAQDMLTETEITPGTIDIGSYEYKIVRLKR